MRTALLPALGLLLLAPAARVAARDCGSAVTFPPACVGETATATTRFCFNADAACAGAGVVVRVRPPTAPFAIVAMRREGPLGAAPLSAGDFPVVLAPFEAIAVDLSASLTTAGDFGSRLVWVTTDLLTDDRDKDGDQTDTCGVDLGVSAPSCAADACHGGGTCVGGVCTGGGTTVSCDDGDPCTADSCDPDRGCVHGPLSGVACDDGDACTTNDTCQEGHCAGRPKRCADDGLACTSEACVAGACQHVPDDSLCGGDTCAIGSCRPGDPAADNRGCVFVQVGEGQPCADDGIPCTDDVCTGGGCLHIPIDGRCAPSDQCTASVCAPERADRDAQGCATASAGDAAPQPDPGTCAEDGDPCTDDVCTTGLCQHQAVVDHAACAPITGAFRKALGLSNAARSLMQDVSTMAGADGVSPAVSGGLTNPLARIEVDLDAATRALAGKLAEPPGTPPPADGFPETSARQRARIALAQLHGTPRRVGGFLAAVVQARGRAVPRDEATRLSGHGRALRRGIRSLKADLKALQGVSHTFAR